jgi:hypothetical protein
MSLTVTCDCGKRLQVKDSLAGKRIRCPGCQELLTVPAPEDEEPAEEEPEPVKPKARSASKAPAKPVKPARRPEPEEGEEEEEPPPKKRGKARQEEEDEDEEEAPHARAKGKGQSKAKAKKASSPLPLVLAAGGGVLVLVGAVVAVVIFVNSQGDSKKAGPPPQADQGDQGGKKKGGGKTGGDGKDQLSGEVVKLDAEQLMLEYLENKKATVQKYRGKVLEVTGLLASPPRDPDMSGKLMGRFHANHPKGGQWLQVHFTLPLKDSDRVKGMIVGQVLKVRARLDTSEAVDPVLLDSQLVEVGNPYPVVATLTAEQLAKAFHADPDATNKKYRGRRVEITGVVDFPFSATHYAHVVVQGYAPDSANDYTPLNCKFSAAEEDRCLAFSRGQTIKIQGTFTHVGQGPELWECRLVEVGKDTAAVLTAAQLTKEFATAKEATAKKYHGQPLLLEGVVADIEMIGGFTFLLAGHDEAAETPLRVEVKFLDTVSKTVENRLAAVKKGQTIQVRGVGGLVVGDDMIHLNYATLQKSPK